MKEKIELGDTVQDIYSGFKGVVVARTEYINGCTQFEVIPKVGKNNKIEDGLSIDEESLKIIKKRVVLKKKPVKKEPPGGASIRITRRGAF